MTLKVYHTLSGIVFQTEMIIGDLKSDNKNTVAQLVITEITSFIM